MGRKSMVPGWGVVLMAAVLGVFSVWCVRLLMNVTEVRSDVEQRVAWLGELSDPDRPPSAATLFSIEGEPELRPHVFELRAAMDAPDGEAAHQTRALQVAIRGQTRDLSIELGQYWTSMYTVAITALVLAALLLGLLIYLTRVLSERAHAREALLVERLAEADRLAVVGTLSAGIAHEISNPLTRAHALLEEAVRTPDPDPALLEGALRAAGRTVDVLRDLRGLARSGTADPSMPVDLIEVLSSAADLAAAALTRVDLKIEIASDLPAVAGRQARLRQLFLNLYTNAAQAMGQRPGAAIVVRARVVGEHVQVDVEDNGPGIPAHMRQRAFEPFLTTKGKDGTGLGLFMCRRICESLGGTIEMVAATGGKGTKVQVVLPAAEASGGRADVAPTRPRQRLRILVVDDEPGLAEAIGMLLRDYSVTTATSGSAALDIVERAPGFDACLCDLDLPDMRGDHVLQTLKRSGRALARHFILMSGHDRAYDSAEPHLRKPFTRTELRAAVREATESEARARRSSP